MMTSFPQDPAFYMAAYKRRQSVDTTDRTDKMLLLQTKATKKLTLKSRAVCTSEQQLSGRSELIWREINKMDQTPMADCEREVWADLRLPFTGQSELSVQQSCVIMKQSAIKRCSAEIRKEEHQKQLNLNFILSYLDRQYFQWHQVISNLHFNLTFKK